MTKRLVAVALAVVMVAPREARAQMEQVEPGARVRGRAPAAGVKRFDATVIANTGDTLVIAKDGLLMRLPAERIRKLELYRGRDRRLGVRKGVIGGAAFGFLLGGYTSLVASAHSRTCAEPVASPCEPAPWSKREIWAYTGGFTAVGALSGLGAGALVGLQRWERVTPSRASIVPVPGGIGIRIATGR